MTRVIALLVALAGACNERDGTPSPDPRRATPDTSAFVRSPDEAVVDGLPIVSVGPAHVALVYETTRSSLKPDVASLRVLDRAQLDELANVAIEDCTVTDLEARPDGTAMWVFGVSCRGNPRFAKCDTDCEEKASERWWGFEPTRVQCVEVAWDPRAARAVVTTRSPRVGGVEQLIGSCH